MSAQPSREDLLSQTPQIPSLKSSTPLLLTPNNNKDRNTLQNQIAQHRSASIKQIQEEYGSDEDEANLKQVKVKRLQSRERRERIFKDNMDNKYQQYLDKIKDQTFGSSGVKGVLTSVKNIKSNLKMSPNYTLNRNIVGLQTIDEYRSNNKNQSGLNGYPTSILEIQSDTLSSNLGLMNELRTPQMGVKVDRLNEFQILSSLNEQVLISFHNQFVNTIIQYKIQLAIGVTMYNESWQEFKKTILGVFQAQIDIYLDQIKINKSYSWDDFRDKFVIVLIADGYKNLKKEFKDQATQLGIFEESVFRPFVKVVEHSSNNKEDLKNIFEIKEIIKIKLESEEEMHSHSEPIMNIIHCFQSQIKLGEFNFDMDPTMQEFMQNKVNFVFAVKHFNNQKIDSHLYFYRGFCEYLNPEQCLLLDIGTQALPGSINKLVKLLDMNVNIGGACGEIEVEMPQFTILSAAQYFEYKLSHYIDKSFEGCFGFQSVLPGAFSIFRWEAIKGQPLERFFKGLDKSNLNLLQLNMFLAEDRIMCFEIVSQTRSAEDKNQQQAYDLVYLPGAIAVTDPPDRFWKLIAQRRRWINGANATFIHICVNCGKFTQSSHTSLKKALYQVNFLMMLLSNIMGFLTPGIFYGSLSSFLRFLFYSTDTQNPFLIPNFIENIVLLLLIVLVLASIAMGKHINETSIDSKMKIITIMLSLINAFVFIFAMIEFFETALNVLLFLIFFFTFIIPPLLFDLGRTCRNFLQVYGSMIIYIVALPLYMIVFQIYSYANLHDVSWGNRGASKDKNILQQQKLINSENKQIKSELERKKQYKRSRLYIFILWLICNMISAYIMTFFNRNGMGSFLKILAYTLIIYQLVKIIGMFAYKFKHRNLEQQMKRFNQSFADQQQIKTRHSLLRKQDSDNNI